MSLLLVLKPSLAGVSALLNMDALSATIPDTFTEGSSGNRMGCWNFSRLDLDDRVLRSLSILKKNTMTSGIGHVKFMQRSCERSHRGH